MTSSFMLQKRKEMGDVWKIACDDDGLGGWSNHYITPGHTHECHPNYTSISMGSPYGFTMCVKRKGIGGKYLDVPQSEIDPSVYNGYNKFQADLYRPWRQTQIQMYNPFNYYDRTTNNEQEFIQNDYIARATKYNSTGIQPIRTPGPRKYAEYGFDFTNTPPPFKYDENQLQQRYPLWKTEQIYMGQSQDAMDKFDQENKNNRMYQNSGVFS